MNPRTALSCTNWSQFGMVFVVFVSWKCDQYWFRISSRFRHSLVYRNGYVAFTVSALVYVAQSKHVRLNEFSLCLLYVCSVAIHTIPFIWNFEEILCDDWMYWDGEQRICSSLLIGCCVPLSFAKNPSFVVRTTTSYKCMWNGWQQRIRECERLTVFPTSFDSLLAAARLWMFVLWICSFVVIWCDYYFRSANLITHDVYLIDGNVCSTTCLCALSACLFHVRKHSVCLHSVFMPAQECLRLIVMRSPCTAHNFRDFIDTNEISSL